MKKIIIVTIITVYLMAGNAVAAPLDLTGWSNITITDNNHAGDISQPAEVKGVFLSGNQLALVGVYDHNGPDGNGEAAPGDIFISTDRFFSTSGMVSDTTAIGNRGFEYVLDLQYADWKDPATYTFDGVRLFGTPFRPIKPTIKSTTEEGDASPWTYVSGGRSISRDNPVSYFDGVSTPGNDGEDNFALVMDLSAIGFTSGVSVNLFAYFAMRDGTEKMIGFNTSTAGTPPGDQTPIPNPEPATMLLLGFGLIGLAGMTRRSVPHTRGRQA